MKYRIIKHDKLNWAIQAFQAGDGKVTRGLHVGKDKQEKWLPAKSFHPSVRNAALSLLDQAAGDALLAGEATSILEALKLAEARVLETLAAMQPETVQAVP